LPQSIRIAHGGGESRGFMRVSWGERCSARWLARLLGFPQPCARLEVVLHVEPLAEGNRWVRRMGTASLTSTQRAACGLLLESFGWIVCAFRLLSDALGLRYVQEYAALRLGPCQLRLPRWASPRVVARVEQTSAGPLTEVEISAPVVGRLLHYEGIVEPARSEGRP
jgi:hypothetical protein